MTHTRYVVRPVRRRALTALVALCSGMLVPLVTASPASAAGTKVAICHATNSHSNPYRRITVSQSAVNRHGGHHGGPGVWSPGITTRWNDIIPNGSAGYDGSNGSQKSWTAAGIAIYDAVTKTASGRDACKAMTAKQYYDSEIAAGIPQAALLADLNDQEANEDAALRAALGGSFTAANVSQLDSIGARTTGAAPVGSTTATLRGAVTLGRDATSASTPEQADVSFQWGTDPNLTGATTAAATPAAAVGATSGTATTNPTAALTGLTTGTVYYYRVVAVTDAGLGSQASFEGDILSFTAGASTPAPPSAPALSSSAPVNSPQQAAVTVPVGGSFTLLNAGSPVTALTVPNEGTYTQTATAVVFTPANNYTGSVTPAGLRITDAYTQSADGTYSPVITSLPAPPAPTPLTTTGSGTAQHAITVAVPSGGSAALLTGGTAVNSITVSGVGAYALNAQTGALTFTPAAGYAGSPPAVDYRVTDAYGQIGDSTYTPTVTLPAAPAPQPQTSTGVLTAPQAAPVALPAGSVLLDGNGAAAGPVSNPDGTYTLDPATRIVSFAPAAGFTGTAAPVTYRVTDSYGQIGTATYTPTVLPAAPAATPLTSSGTGTQHAAATVPTGGTVVLLDGTTPVATWTVPAQGVYAVDPATGLLTFNPQPGFVGTASPATYRVADVHGRTATASYTPTVLPAPAPVVSLPPPPPPPAPAPVVPLPAPAPAPVLPLPAPLPAPPGPPQTATRPAPSAPVPLPTAVVRDTPRAGLVAVPAVLPKDGGPIKRTVNTTRSAQGLIAPDSTTLGKGRLQVGQATTLPGRFLFQFDSAKLTPKGVQIVKQLVANLKGTKAVHCEGYTDYAGDHKHEMTLSQQRSLAVCKALRTFGANVTYTTQGHAGSKPVALGGQAPQRHENRRVVVVVRK